MVSWASRYVSDARHGPLPGLLLVLTATTGLVDAVSILALGRVFVANMTGNVAFLGFAAAGAPGFSLSASLSALAGFLLGALAGGHLATTHAAHRGKLLRDTVGLELALLLSALAVMAIGPGLDSGVIRGVVAALTAVAMGAQTAAARRLAVPDLTTTVLTMTLTGIAAEARSGIHPALVRRVAAVAAMLVGALAGALLILHVGAEAALAVVVVLMAAVLVAAVGAGRSTATWSRAGDAT